MKIALDITPLITREFTGVQKYTLNQVKRLLGNEPQNEYILTGLIPRSLEKVLKQDFKEFTKVNFKLVKVPARWHEMMGKIWQKLNWPKLEWLIGNFDAYHNFDWWLLPTNKKISATIFDLSPLLFPETVEFKNKELYLNRIDAVLKRADIINPISETIKSEWQKFFPKTNKEIKVVYPIINKGKLNLKLKRVNFLVITSKALRKNTTAVISAYKKLEIKYKKMHKLIIVGNNDLKINDEGIEALGYVSENELNELYAKCLALIYPSTYEGFGMPVAEAMANGMLVIAKKTGAIYEAGGEAIINLNMSDALSIKHAMIKVVAMDRLEKLKLIELGLNWTKKFS